MESIEKIKLEKNQVGWTIKSAESSDAQKQENLQPPGSSHTSWNIETDRVGSVQRKSEEWRKKRESDPSCESWIPLSKSTKKNGESQVPDSMIAAWNNPRLFGFTRCQHTLNAPALSPNMVTREGSPPNRRMLSRTQTRAACYESSRRTKIKWMYKRKQGKKEKPRRGNLSKRATIHLSMVR